MHAHGNFVLAVHGRGSLPGREAVGYRGSADGIRVRLGHSHADGSSRVRDDRRDSRSWKGSDLAVGVLSTMVVHGARRRSRQGERDIGKIASGVVLSHARFPVDEVILDGLPLVLAHGPVRVSWAQSVRALYSLVEDVSSCVFVVLTPLHNLSSHIPDGDARVEVELHELLLSTVVLAITARGEGVELGQDSSSSVEEALKGPRLLHPSGRGWDGPNQWDGIRVDREVVVERVIEQRVRSRDLGVDLEQPPKREISLAGALQDRQS